MDRKIIDRIGQALFEQNVPDFSQFDYCLALDIGGGNCSSAIADLRPNRDTTPRLLKLTKRGETSLWSNIGYEKQPGESGKISIGKRAQNQNYQFSNYKVVPTDQNLELEVLPDNYVMTGDFMKDASVRRSNRELTRDYIHELFQSMLHHPENSALCDVPKDKILIIVGHPSGDEWKDRQAHENLISIVREATGVPSVLTTSESNSAILYALHNRSQIGEADKILIVDLGAYSADITWIDRRKLERRYASMALGGKLVDRNIAETTLENGGLTANELDEGYNLLCECRAVKEQFWPRGDGDLRIFLKASGKEIPVCITNKQFDRAVKEMPVVIQDGVIGQEITRSYTGHLSAFLEEAKTRMKITQVDWVLVTGGAARMKPAMEIICSKAKALWNVQEEQIWPSVISDTLVDESVPFGSLQFCIKSKEVLSGIPDAYEELKKEAGNMVSPMTTKICDGVMAYLVPNALEPVLRKFRDTDSINTIEMLEDTLKKEMDRYVHKYEIRKIAEEKAEEVANDRKGNFQKIVAKFLKKLYGRTASTVAWNWGTRINPDVAFDEKISSTIREAVSSSIGAAVAAILVVVTMIFAPLLLLAVVAVGVGYEAITSSWREKHYTPEQMAEWKRKQEKKQEEKRKKEEQKELEERRKERNGFERARIYKKVMSEETQSEIRQKVEEKIRVQLKTSCDATGFGVPATYLDHLTEDICNAVYTGL